MKKQLVQKKDNVKLMEILKNFLIAYNLSNNLKFIQWKGSNGVDLNLTVYMCVCKLEIIFI